MSSNSDVSEQTLSMPPLQSRARSTYILVGDNIDKTISARHMTMEHQSQSLHYFHFYAAQDRIDFLHLDNASPIGNVADLPLSTFLPSAEDCDTLHNNYVVLIAWEVVQRLSYFSSFSDCVPQHIEHQYSGELACKSNIVSKFYIVHIYIYIYIYVYIYI